MNKISPHSTPPWSPQEVQSLNDYQTEGYMHPFTCVCGKNLLATATGWQCECGHTQNWAHKFMADGSWRRHAEDMKAFFHPGP